ncbi:hypothetical protein T02_9071 [Trichinella nativa]|uniref:Uncharacterized protein n=1 Tax=Trichinella nativa TaxID=6335 RepID=A0A0V1LME5_9BILA|nr:hypothetical protein T02_9071 [Trichinella nativa]
MNGGWMETEEQERRAVKHCPFPLEGICSCSRQALDQPIRTIVHSKLTKRIEPIAQGDVSLPIGLGNSKQNRFIQSYTSANHIANNLCSRKVGVVYNY